MAGLTSTTRVSTRIAQLPQHFPVGLHFHEESTSILLTAFPWSPSIFAIHHHLSVFYSAACYRILIVETHHWCLVSCAIVSLFSVLYFFLCFIVTHSIFIQNHKGKLIKKKLKTQKEVIHEVILTCIFMWSGPFCTAMLFFFFSN